MKLSLPWFLKSRRASHVEKCGLEGKLAEMSSQLDHVLDANDGLIDAMAEQKKRNDANIEYSLLQMACLISAAGGKVRISKDLLQAVNASAPYINFVNEPDGGLVYELITQEDAPANQDSE